MGLLTPLNWAERFASKSGRGRSARPSLETLEAREVPAGAVFFGNGLTATEQVQVAPLFQQVAALAGQTVGVARAPSAERLIDHANAVNAAAVAQLAPGGQASLVIMQGQTQEAAAALAVAEGADTFRSGAKALAEDVKAAFPRARIILFETAALPANNSTVYPDSYPDPAQMQDDILAAYGAAAQDLRAIYGNAAVEVAPVGEAFRLLDYSGTLYVPVEGSPDAGGLPSQRGALLAALTIYAAAYHDNVSDIPASNAAALLQSVGLTGEDWAQLTSAADRAVGRVASARNRAFVGQLYREVLNRQADDSGLNNWNDALDSGTLNRPQVVAAFLNSGEYHRGTVSAMYRYLLGREPDAGGLSAFVAQLQAGASTDAVALSILASPEYIARSGGTAEGYIRSLYGQILDRAGSDAEVASWKAAVAGGMKPADIARVFLFSEESCARRVRTLYQNYLGRAPEAAGLSGFVTSLRQGARFQDVCAAMLGGEEFYMLRG